VAVSARKLALVVKDERRFFSDENAPHDLYLLNILNGKTSVRLKLKQKYHNYSSTNAVKIIGTSEVSVHRDERYFSIDPFEYEDSIHFRRTIYIIISGKKPRDNFNIEFSESSFSHGTFYFNISIEIITGYIRILNIGKANQWSPKIIV